jgi:hypothetical protein
MEILFRRKKANDLLDPTEQSEYVFPAIQSPLKPIDKKRMMYVLHVMGYKDIHTLHGFRALGMGIAKEKLGYRHEVPDRQLAHVPASDVDRALFFGRKNGNDAAVGGLYRPVPEHCNLK